MKESMYYCTGLEKDFYLPRRLLMVVPGILFYDFFGF